jgi:hypothetical protein
MDQEYSPAKVLPNLEFWSNRRIAVTGGAGFLGSFLVEKLRQSGADVFWLSQKITSGCCGTPGRI